MHFVYFLDEAYRYSHSRSFQYYFCYTQANMQCMMAPFIAVFHNIDN